MSDNFYQGKKVLVTGGSGFVGTHFVKQLLEKGAHIRVPLHRRMMRVEDQAIETMPADLTILEDCLRVMEGVDYVFHAAGAVSAAGVTTNKNPLSPITSNLILTARVLEAAWSAKVKRCLIFSSSTGYPVTEHPVKEEEMWLGPTHSTYFGYGWMRRYLERIAEFVAMRSEVKIALIRPTAVYGSYDDFDPVTSHVIPALIRKAVEKQDPYEVWGTGEETRDFLHISDLVRGCLLAMEKHAEGDPINIGYGKHTTIKQIVNYILQAANHKPRELIFNSSKPTTIPHRMVDVSKAKKVLGFEPKISLEEGLTDTVGWYSQQIRSK